MKDSRNQDPKNQDPKNQDPKITRREAIKRTGAAVVALPIVNNIIPFAPAQPSPDIVWVTHVPRHGGAATVITRLWGDDPAGKCKLCPHHDCGVVRNICVVSTNQDIANADARMFVLPPERKAAKA